jgi:DNA-binding NarL/FixJ family response regulator
LKILLVDDHALVRAGTRRLLETQPDFEIVGEAGDGEEAVRLASNLKPDVIVMDIAMPRMTGIEATKIIKQSNPSVAVLALTGYDYDEYIFALLEAGAAGYMLKDISGDDLISAIRAVRNGEPVLHPTVVRKMMGRFRETLDTTSENRELTELSDREHEILKQAALGISNLQIADKLHLSQRTVQAHLSTIFEKLNVGSRSEAILLGLKRGWLTLEDIGGQVH